MTLPKTAEREEARRLREQGMPYRRIANRLSVSPTSVYGWTRDIPLTPEQVRLNKQGPGGPQDPVAAQRRAAAWSARCRARRASYQAEGRRRARDADPLHLAGCMLYWAEGTKGRNSVRLVNSDGQMLRLFRRFLVESLEVDPDRIRISLNVYTNNGLSLARIEQWWLEALDLPGTALRGHTLNSMPTSSSGRSKRRLPYGICMLSVGGTRTVQHIYGAIQEYGGFEEPRWLG